MICNHCGAAGEVDETDPKWWECPRCHWAQPRPLAHAQADRVSDRVVALVRDELRAKDSDVLEIQLGLMLGLLSFMASAPTDEAPRHLAAAARALERCVRDVLAEDAAEHHRPTRLTQ